MTYTYPAPIQNDFASTLSGGFHSSLNAPPPIEESRRHPSVIAAIQNRPPEVELAPDRAVADAYEQRLVRSLSYFQRMQTWNGRQLADAAEWMRPHLPLGMLGQGPRDGADQVDQLRQMLFAALQEMRDIPTGELPSIGRYMLITKAANVSAEVGFAVTPRDLAATALGDLTWFTQQAGGPIEGLTADYNGRQIATSFKDQGEPVSTLRKLGSTLGDMYGKVNDWSQTNGLADMAAFAEGTGVRGILENAIGSAGGKWLNPQTLGKVVGAARQVAGAIQSMKPGAIVTSVGSVIAMVGAVVPQPAGAIVSAVGALISLIGALIDWLMGTPPPPPKLMPCVLPKADAWACLRIFLAAQGKVDDKTSVQDLRVEGWDVQVDIYTGEVLVMVPGSSIYRRILDVFDRGILLRSYLEGKLYQWIYGGLSITDAYVQPPSGSAGEGVGLWCYPQKDETVARYIAADVSSAALRFRVHAKSEDGEPVDAWRGHGAKGIGWGWIGNNTPFAREYRGAVLASAFFGGTMPYGRVELIDGAGICTGVGGSYEGKVSDGSLKVKRPIMCRFDPDAKDAQGGVGMYIIGPTVRPSDVASDASGISPGEADRKAKFPMVKGDKATVKTTYKYNNPLLPVRTNVCGSCVSWKTHGVPFHEFAQRVLDDGKWRVQLRIPSNSPKMVDVPAVDLTKPAATSPSRSTPSRSISSRPTPIKQFPTIRPSTVKTGLVAAPSRGMSTTKKVVIGVGVGVAVATAGVGGYVLYKKRKKH